MLTKCLYAHIFGTAAILIRQDSCLFALLWNLTFLCALLASKFLYLYAVQNFGLGQEQVELQSARQCIMTNLVSCINIIGI